MSDRQKEKNEREREREERHVQIYKTTRDYTITDKGESGGQRKLKRERKGEYEKFNEREQQTYIQKNRNTKRMTVIQNERERERERERVSLRCPIAILTFNVVNCNDVLN